MSVHTRPSSWTGAVVLPDEQMLCYDYLFYVCTDVVSVTLYWLAHLKVTNSINSRLNTITLHTRHGMSYRSTSIGHKL